MKSKWYKLKGEAIELRKKGASIRKIESKFSIPRSTLSYWFKDVKLNSRQKNRLIANRNKGLVKAREKAAKWHTEQKEKRILEAEKKARKTLKQINIKNNNTLELALAILYLGEGFKKTKGIGLGSSDPKTLKFFIKCFKRIYNINNDEFKCELHLRADQNPSRIKTFWSRELNIPLSNFRSITFDKRTSKTKTYPTYKGVCALRCGNINIQRKLMYLSQLYLDEVIENKGD